MNKEEMQACFKGLGDTMATAIGAALAANQEAMNKAMKAAINARHKKSRPDIILPAQNPRHDRSAQDRGVHRQGCSHHLSVFDVSIEFSHDA